MTDPRIANHATILVQYCCDVQPGETVVVEGSALAEPLIAACYEEIIKAGGLPIVNMAPLGLQEVFFNHANDQQIAWVPPTQAWAAEHADARIGINAPSNTRELSHVAGERQAARQRAMQPIMQRIMARGATGELKWVGTNHPTHMLAAEADLSLRRYEDLFYSACRADRPDPVAEWKSAAAETQRLNDWMQGHRDIHIVGPGTDLRLSVEGRTWIAGDGRNNMPCGEFFTGPVEDSAEGHITFHYPTIHGGREVSGITMKFEAGKVVDARAERGESYLIETLDTDPGARFLGEIGIGTNFSIPHGTRSILLDEKIGGTVHLAVGQSYPETGGTNESAVHWDMICDLKDGGSITVDGELLQRDGAFLV